MKIRYDSDSLSDQVVLITAGAAGIGRCIAEKFLSNGCPVHICDIDQAAIDEFLADNPSASASVADVSDVGQVEELFRDFSGRYGRLDVLVNNAGIAGPAANLEDISTEDWDKTIAVDINGQFYVTRLAVPIMKQTGSGSIINISSSAGLFGCPKRAPYVASKWAIIGVTKTLAMELGPWGIRVNAICPGSVEGSRIERVIERDACNRDCSPEEIRRIYQCQISLRRFVTADEVANMAIFLASDMGGSISGQAIGVDGHTESLSNVMD
jgi:NAD(P)-dependent dehydrogenase (short-subunit alcohol dehydrogenase family)